MDLKGQRLALLGFGVENQALGAWLASRGCSFSVCDRRPESRVTDPAWDGSVTQWRLGEAALADLTDFDVLFRSPGISARQTELNAAVAAGVRLSSGTELFLQCCPAPVIAVTGTKGKGTTASLLMSILDAAGVAARIGGNIGIPPVTSSCWNCPAFSCRISVPARKAPCCCPSPQITWTTTNPARSTLQPRVRSADISDLTTGYLPLPVVPRQNHWQHAVRDGT
jgi:hypothetical protein